MWTSQHDDEPISRHVFSDLFTHNNQTIGHVLFDYFFYVGRSALSANSGSKHHHDQESPRRVAASETLPSSLFIAGAQRVLLLTSDEDQVDFYLRAFGSCYTGSHEADNINGSDDDSSDDGDDKSAVDDGEGVGDDDEDNRKASSPSPTSSSPGLLDSERISCKALRALVVQAFEMAMWAHPQTVHVSLRFDNILSAVANSCLHGQSSVSVVYARNWVLHNCRRLLQWLHRWLLHRLSTAAEQLLREQKQQQQQQQKEEQHVQTESSATASVKDNPDDQSGAQQMLPEVPSTNSCVLDSACASSVASLHPALLWLLMCALPDVHTRPACDHHSLPSTLGLARLDPGQFIARMLESLTPTHWVSLYSSDEQGLSANRFQHLVLTYTGPTIMLVRCERDFLFCVATDVGWKDSPHYWGGVDSMALKLLPQFQALCQKQSDLLYYNVSSRGLATGMRVGSDRRQPALAIDRQLNTCHYRGIPLRVCGVEVWGCGDSQTRDRQLHTQKREMVRVEQRRRVNLMADSYSWQENPDKYLLELSGTRQSFNYQ